MKYVSLPLALVGLAGLLLGGCDNHSSQATLKDSNPDVSMALTSGGTSTTEGEASVDIPVTISFSEALVNPITLTFTTSGTASSGSDYILQSSEVIIEPGDTTLNGAVYEADFVLVTIKDDNEADEGTESIDVTLSEISYGQLVLPITVTVNITDDEPVTVTKISN